MGQVEITFFNVLSCFLDFLNWINSKQNTITYISVLKMIHSVVSTLITFLSFQKLPLIISTNNEVFYQQKLNIIFLIYFVLMWINFNIKLVGLEAILKNGNCTFFSAFIRHLIILRGPAPLNQSFG